MSLSSTVEAKINSPGLTNPNMRYAGAPTKQRGQQKHEVFVGIFEEKRPLGRPIRRFENNIKMEPKEHRRM